MSNAGVNVITGAVGTKGYGKSHCLMELVRSYPRFIVFDTMHQYDPQKERIPLAVTCKAAGGYMLQQRDALCFNMIFHPDFDEEIRLQQLEWICKIAFHVKKCAVLIDEIDRYCSANYTPDGIKKMVDYGRLVEVSMLWSARRFSSVSRLLTSQTDDLYLFYQKEPVDVEAISKRSHEAGELVLTLQKRQAIVLRGGQPELERYGEWNNENQPIDRGTPSIQE